MSISEDEGREIEHERESTMRHRSSDVKFWILLNVIFAAGQTAGGHPPWSLIGVALLLIPYFIEMRGRE